jgi:hypothetical protein
MPLTHTFEQSKDEIARPIMPMKPCGAVGWASMPEFDR